MVIIISQTGGRRARGGTTNVLDSKIQYLCFDTMSVIKRQGFAKMWPNVSLNTRRSAESYITAIVDG